MGRIRIRECGGGGGGGAPSRGEVAGLARVLEDGVARDLFPGAVFGFGRVDRWHAEGTVGKPSPRASRNVRATDLYDMASVTKPTVTATVAVRLHARGILDMEAPVSDLLRRRLRGRWARVRVRHLITHTSGVAPHAPLYRSCRATDEMVDAILAMPIDPPGTRYGYSCLGYILLGAALAALTGKPLDTLAAAEVWDPMGMPRACFRPPARLRSRVAPTEFCAWQKRRIRGEVHDENARAAGGVSGNAGLFASALDMRRYAEGILRNRDRAGARFLGPASYRLLTVNQLSSIGGHAACGWVLARYGLFRGLTMWSRRAISHTGFTGTSLILDPASGGYAFLLANRVYFGRERFDEFAVVRRAFWAGAGELVAE